MLVTLVKRLCVHIFLVYLINLYPGLEGRGLAVRILVEEPPELFRDDALELIQLVDELRDFPVKGKHVFFKGEDLVPDGSLDAVDVH